MGANEYIAPAPAPPPPAPVPPRPPVSLPAGKVGLDKLTLTRRRFARSTKSTPTTATAAQAKSKKKTPRGTTIGLRISRKATVKIEVQRVLSGRRSGKKCVTPTKALRKRTRCKRYRTSGTLTRTYASGGSKKVAFSGRIGSRALAAGSYRLRVSATDGPGTTSTIRTITFTIARR